MSKLQEHAMKSVERVSKRQIRTLINFNRMQLGFMTGKGIVDAIFNVRRMQERKEVVYKCFVDTKKHLIQFHES